MGEFIGNNLGVYVGPVGEQDALVLSSCVPHRPLESRHGCDMPVRWSHLSTADCHLVLPSLTDLSNYYLASSTQCFKLALVTPILKKR